MGEGEDLIINTRIDIDYADVKKKVGELTKILDDACKDRNISLDADISTSGSDGNEPIPNGDGNEVESSKTLLEILNEIKELRKQLVPIPAVVPNVKPGRTKSKRRDEVSTGNQKATNATKLFTNAIMNLAKRLLGLHVVIKAFGAFFSYFKRVLQFNQEFRAAFADLKGALLSLIQPIIEFAIPIAIQVVNLLTKIIVTLGKLVSSVFGKSFAQEVKNAEALYNTLRNVNKTVADYDELSVINRDNTIYPSFDFDQTGFDLSFIEEILQKIVDRMKELAQLFAIGFMEEFDPSILDGVLDNINSIKDSLLYIFSDGEVLNAFNRLLDSIAYNLGRLVGDVTNVAMACVKAVTGIISKALKMDAPRIKDWLISMFDIGSEVVQLIGDGIGAISDIIVGVVTGESFQSIGANLVSIFSQSFMFITELAANLGEDIINLIVIPLIDNSEKITETINNILRPIDEVISAVRDGLVEAFEHFNEVYDAKIRPAFESIASTISDIISITLDGWNQYIQPLLDKIGSGISDTIKNHITPAFEAVEDCIGNLAELVSIFFSDYIKPAWDWIVNTVVPYIMPFFDELWNTIKSVVDRIVDSFRHLFEKLNEFWDKFGKPFFSFIGEAVNFLMQYVIGPLIKWLLGDIMTDIKGFFQSIKNLFSDILDVFDGVIDFIVGIFTGDLKGAVNGIIKILNGAINFFIDGMNILINGVNAITVPIRTIISTIGEVFGGKNIGDVIRIPTIPRVAIPQLANGAVVPPNREFLAMLGDNKRETEVVSPLSTMKEALVEALSETNSNNNQPIVLQLDGRTVAQVVWDEDRKRYKQYGAYAPI